MRWCVFVCRCRFLDVWWPDDVYIASTQSTDSLRTENWIEFVIRKNEKIVWQFCERSSEREKSIDERCATNRPHCSWQQTKVKTKQNRFESNEPTVRKMAATFDPHCGWHVIVPNHGTQSVIARAAKCQYTVQIFTRYRHLRFVRDPRSVVTRLLLTIFDFGWFRLNSTRKQFSTFFVLMPTKRRLILGGRTR